MANNTTGLTRIIKAAAIPGKVYALHGSTKRHSVRKRSGIVGGGHRLLAGCGRDYRVLLISSVMLVMIVEILNSASKPWLTELALNTMSFPDALKYGIRRGADCDYRRRDYLVHLLWSHFG